MERLTFQSKKRLLIVIVELKGILTQGHGL